MSVLCSVSSRAHRTILDATSAGQYEGLVNNRGAQTAGRMQVPACSFAIPAPPQLNPKFFYIFKYFKPDVYPKIRRPNTEQCF